MNDRVSIPCGASLTEKSIIVLCTSAGLGSQSGVNKRSGAQPQAPMTADQMAEHYQLLLDEPSSRYNQSQQAGVRNTLHEEVILTRYRLYLALSRHNSIHAFERLLSSVSMQRESSPLARSKLISTRVITHGIYLCFSLISSLLLSPLE